MQEENSDKKSVYTNAGDLPIKQIQTACKCIRIFKPIGNLTNPLWVICSPFLTEYYVKMESFKKFLPVIEKHKNEVSVSDKKLYRDLVYSMFAFGSDPDLYFDLKFYRLTNNAKSKFLTTIKNYEFLWQMNDISKAERLNNRALVAEKFSKWYKRNWTTLTEKNDVQSCVEFLKENGECFIKPLTGGLGNGIQLVFAEKIKNPEEFFNSRLNEGSWIVEERIHQHPIMAAIHPSSVNTIRVHTVLSKKGKVKIFYPYMKMGKGGSVMDNFASGGYEAMVDAGTGIVCGSLFPFEKEQLIRHPDTGCKVIGMQIPEWDKLRKTAEEVAQVYPDFRYIGWDFAYTEDRGWLIVEGNLHPGTPAYQEVTGFGLLDKFDEIRRWSDEN